MFYVVATVGCLGLLVQLLPGRGVKLANDEPASAAGKTAPHTTDESPHQAQRAEVARRFEEATVMLHAKRFEYALVALDRVLELSPSMPEAHTNRGYALLGLDRPQASRQAFERALALRAEQTNAYYGLGMALDELGDRAGALGAMRTFVHLSEPSDPFVRKARAALWEWQSPEPETARAPLSAAAAEQPPKTPAESDPS